MGLTHSGTFPRQALSYNGHYKDLSIQAVILQGCRVQQLFSTGITMSVAEHALL